MDEALRSLQRLTRSYYDAEGAWRPSEVQRIRGNRGTKTRQLLLHGLALGFKGS